MTQGLFKAVVVLAPKSGLPEDERVNDFYFVQYDLGTGTNETVDDIRDRLVSFYNTIHAPATKSISQLLGDQVSRATNACSIVCYEKNLAFPDGLWGSPAGVRNFTMGVADVTEGLPAEVAIGLSFHADLDDVPETAANPTPPPLTIRPAARRRGRVYLGPWSRTNVLGADVATGDGIPATMVLNVIANSAGFLLAQNTGVDLKWSTWSPTGSEYHDVVGGYVDNAFDTQRRRGSAPTNRGTFGV